MAMRSEEEHSYRSMMLGLLDVAFGAAIQLAKEVVNPPLKNPELLRDAKVVAGLVSQVTELLDLAYARRWLEGLDEKSCPDVLSMRDQVVRRLEGGEGVAVVVAALLEEMMRPENAPRGLEGVARAFQREAEEAVRKEKGK